MGRALPLLAWCYLASGCLWDSTLDSTTWHVRAKLVSHFEAVPALGTSRTYQLEVAGFDPLPVSCTATSGQLSAAPDGKRVAYRCGGDWRVVYLEGRQLFDTCGAGPTGSSFDWGRAKPFQDAISDLAECGQLEPLVEAMKAEGMAEPAIVEALSRPLERGSAPAGYAYKVGKLSPSLAQAVRARVAPQLASGAPTFAALAERVELVGLDDRTEPALLSALEKAEAPSPEALDSLVRNVAERRGPPAAARFACRMLKGEADGVLLGVLAQSVEPCPAFERQLTAAMADPKLGCSKHAHCDEGRCRIDLIPNWLASTHFQEDDARDLLLYAAAQRHVLPPDLALAVQRASYVVEMPQAPLCERARRGERCHCEFTLCELGRGQALRNWGGCVIRIDDQHHRVRANAP